ncbi:hypothetical protein B5M47_01085 [candidate division CPR3 bacterium 4484_211]|uniref:ABC3 transporter permease protein domain-containing protein n=1 Tax=candidate division CPR3 bacterium 4484_211 TaxID=1968527 RepID=A0A1W9NZ51_UNCC3|nr:MAG: hypothetical protein B5M47_01085 [candidate division CPR3 bacterium 4484_211]
MKISSLFIIAFKTLFGKKLRSLLTIGGVTVGIGAIVFLVSLGYGVENLIVERITGLDALRIIDVSTIKSKIVRLDRETLERLSSLQNVEAVEPLISSPGQISFGGSSTDVVVFASSQEYIEMSGIKASFGSVFDPGTDKLIVNAAVLRLVGVDEANYGQTVGQQAKLNVIINAEQQRSESVPNPEAKSIEKDLSIAGVISDNETPYVFVPRELLEKEGVLNYSQAKVKVKNKSDLELVRQKIESLGLSTTSASDTVQQIDQIFSLFRIILAALGSIALVVAALGMFNTLTVSLLERTREVGLMKALGAKKRDVFSLFLSEAMIISCIGGGLGVVFGFFLGEGANYILNYLAQSTGNEPVDIFHTPFFFVLIIILFSFVVGFITGMYPSRRASRLNPLDALRYE